MRFRYGVLAAVIVLALTGCGSSKKSGSPSGQLGATTTVAGGSTQITRPSYCNNATLTSPEIGVTSSTITVTVMADTGSPIRPGLFLGSINAVKAWGDYINANGGLACRRVVVKTADSKLTPDDAKNGAAQACSDSLAMVGTTALFLQNVSAMEQCKDKSGAATGIPDIAELQTEVAQQCSPISFATLPTGAACPYSGTGKRHFSVGQTQYDYYLNKFGKGTLHGVFVIPKDLASTIASTTPIYAAENRMGIKTDQEFGKSGGDLQPAYTEVAQAIKANHSTYARNGLDYKGTVLMRKEAKAQGVTSVKVWDCSVQCYDKRTITEGEGATQDQYVWLNILPMEDGPSANPELANFLKYDKKPDGFGEQAWVAGEIFATAVRNAVSANNNDPNAITRKDILAAIRGIHDFDANGMIPKEDVGAKKGSTCLVGMQVQGTKFVRIDPATPGTFDCDNNKPPIQFDLDPAAAYKG